MGSRCRGGAGVAVPVGRLGDGIPTATCPVTGRSVILPASALRMKEAVTVNCPACGRPHLWEPATHSLSRACEAPGE